MLQISYFYKFRLSFEKNYLFPDIPKNHQKIDKRARNVDMCDEQRDFDAYNVNEIFALKP